MPLLPALAIAGLGIQGLNSVYNIFQGRGQREKGESILRNLRRPVYSTPTEIGKNLSLAEGQYRDTRLPGQAQAENKLNANTSKLVRMARDNGKSPSEILATAIAGNENQNQGYNELATEAADRQLQDLMNYQKALETKADYREKEWLYNEYMPYQQERQYAESLIGGGAKNFNSGVNDFASGLTTFGLSGGDEGLSGMFNKMRARRYNRFKNGLSFKAPTSIEDVDFTELPA